MAAIQAGRAARGRGAGPSIAGGGGAAAPRAEVGFTLRGPAGALAADRVILATGGRSLPKSGSDGHGYELARRLGHTTTARILPALVPLALHESSFVRRLAGVTLPTAITL